MKPGDLCIIDPNLLAVFPNPATGTGVLHGLINMHIFSQAVEDKDGNMIWDAMEFFSEIDLKIPALFLQEFNLREFFESFEEEIIELGDDAWLDDRNCLILFDGKVCLCDKGHLTLYNE